MSSSLPLAGIKVIELGTIIAGSFAGSLLAELGAEIIKVEAPNAPDGLRQMGHRPSGVPLWWGVASRAKTCISLDLKEPSGKENLRSLLSTADVLVENFRPGVLDRLGFGWDRLQRDHEKLVMLSISGFGQSGPNSAKPGFGKIAEGLSGIVTLTGDPEDRPLFVGFSLADAACGLLGAYAVTVALYHRDVLGGKGGRIDLALYEGLFRMLDAQLPIHAMEGVVPRRTGSQDPYCWGTDVPGRPVFAAVRSAEAQWLVMSLPADRIFAVNLICGGLPGDRLDLPALRGWTGLRNADSIRAQLQETGAEIAPVLDGLSIASEAYLLSRRDVVPVPDERFPSLFAPGPIVKADGNLAKPFRPRGVGESNAAIFGPSAESTL